MKKIILFITCLSFISTSNAQHSSHNLFGIDLNLDWYSLTNYSFVTYSSASNDKTNDFPYVVTDFEYSHDKININFLNIGYDELLLGFPKSMEGKLRDCRPEIFLSRKYYRDLTDYLKKSDNDISITKDLLINVFGEPQLNSIRDKSSVFQWKGDNYQIILSCKEDDLLTTVIYIKQ